MGEESQFELPLASCHQKITFKNRRLPAKMEQQEPDLYSHIDNPQTEKIVGTIIFWTLESSYER